LEGDKMENNIEEKDKERSEFFWHTYYGFPSEMLGYAFLIVTLIYIIFMISVAIGSY